MAGGSGGPVFRPKEDLRPGKYSFDLEVVGFVYEYQPPGNLMPDGLVTARYVDCVERSGLLRNDPILPPRRCKVSDFLKPKRWGQKRPGARGKRR
jgi:hypothetical protein